MPKITNPAKLSHTATYRRVQDEVTQGHPQRARLYEELEGHLPQGSVVIAFFTSFVFPVIREDKDVILEETLQNTDMSARAMA